MGSVTREEAYEKYADDLVRFATGLVGPSDGPDLVSAAMVGILSMRAWESVRNPRAYLYQAVLNEARRSYKRTMRRRAGEIRAAASLGSGELPEVRPDVLQAIGTLSVRQRAVVFLVYWEDMRPVEVGRHLGITEGTVHRHLSRAEARLRRMLND